MFRKVFNWMLMAAMVCSLTATVTACSDDDDDSSTEQRNADANPLDTDEARVAFRWICALTDESTIDDNWKSKTYDVTVGHPSESNPLYRLIIVKDLNEAKEDFSRLANLTPDELSTEQTVDGGAAGTMKWTRSEQGAQNLAEVEVNSRIMPRLQKIVYCTADQVGQNVCSGTR